MTPSGRVAVLGRIFAHYRYGALERNISTSSWKNGNVKIQILKFHCGLKNRRVKKEKILSLKCKPCIRFEDEVNSTSTFKKTWINGYTGGRLVSLKAHCSGKPHMKASRSFKASVLKFSAEVGQKEVDTRIRTARKKS